MNIEFTIERFEGEFATLNNGDDWKIKWPIKKLPKNSKEQQKIYFHISDQEKENAKDIINEILKS